MAAGLSGYLHFYGELSPYKRIVVSVAGVLLMIPGWVTDFIGACLLFVFVILGLVRRSTSKEEGRLAAEG